MTLTVTHLNIEGRHQSNSKRVSIVISGAIIFRRSSTGQREHDVTTL